MGAIEKDLSLGTMSCGDFLRATSLQYPDKVGFIDGLRGGRFTYREVNVRVNSLSHGLMKMGLNKGDTCVTLMFNRIEYIEAFWALSKTGVIMAALPYRLLGKEMELLINHCQAKAIIFSEEFLEIVNSVRNNCKSLKTFIFVGENKPDYAIPFEDLANNYETHEPDIEILAEDEQTLNFTSGTTGIPKGFLLNNFHNTFAPILIGAHIWEISHKSIVLDPFPMYGRIGWLGQVITTWAAATQIFIDFNPRKCLEIIEREKVESVHLVATMAEMMLREPDMDKFNLSSLHHVVFTGSPLSESTLNKVRAKICPMVHLYYGFQEGNLSAWIKGEELYKRPGSTGVPPAGVKLRIVDANDHDVPQGEFGEVAVKGPHLFKGYYKDPDKNKAVIKNGWFHTGDMGRIDKDGYLYLMGRVKDMIISGGQNIYAIEVEDILSSHPKVLDCAVIGIPDDLWGEVVAAVIVPKPGEKIQEDEIIQFCKENMAHFKAPKIVKFTDTIPRNPAGKVQKFILRDQYKSS
jgi:acyl-CoA synthetase (AMP-forming)/AMP-acid ligase II